MMRLDFFGILNHVVLFHHQKATPYGVALCLNTLSFPFLDQRMLK